MFHAWFSKSIRVGNYSEVCFVIGLTTGMNLRSQIECPNYLETWFSVSEKMNDTIKTFDF